MSARVSLVIESISVWGADRIFSMLLSFSCIIIESQITCGQLTSIDASRYSLPQADSQAGRQADSQAGCRADIILLYYYLY